MTHGLIRLVTMAAVLGLPISTITTAHGAEQRASQRTVRAPVAKVSDYSWIDRADALWEAIGDAPPDFTFSYQGLEPWAWQLADGHQIIVEDAGEQGGIRSYYFAPGAVTPFLVVEPGASFGFTGARVAMVYGPDGGAVARAKWGKRPARGQTLFARARLIKRALERERRGIDPYEWSDTSELILSFLGQWELGQTRYSGWRTHRGSAEGKERRRRLERERERRQGEASDFERWHRGNMHGPQSPGFEPGRGRRPDRPGQPGAGRPGRPPWTEGQQRYPRPVREPVDPALLEPALPGSPVRQPGGARPDRPARPAIEDRAPAPAAPLPGAGRPDRPNRGDGRPPRVQPGTPGPQPVENRPSRPARPAPDAQPPAAPVQQPAEPRRPVEAQPQPVPPVERADPPATRPDRPNRGEGRPPRVPPAEPTPQPIEVRPQPVEPVPQPVEIRPQPVEPAPQPVEIRSAEPQPAPPPVVAEPQAEAPAPSPRPAKLEWLERPRPQVERPEAPRPDRFVADPQPMPAPAPEPSPPPPPPPQPEPTPAPPPADPAPEASAETPG